MPSLHLISNHTSFDDLKKNLERYTQDKDHLLFIGDACITTTNKLLADYLLNTNLFISVLAADCQCRGINHLIPESFKTISDAQMVELTISHQAIISW